MEPKPAGFIGLFAPVLSTLWSFYLIKPRMKERFVYQFFICYNVNLSNNAQCNYYGNK